MNREEVVSRFLDAVEVFASENHELFKRGVGERTLVGSLRRYVAQRFQDWNVDTEYNRHIEEPKYLPRYEQLLEENGLQHPDEPQPRSIDLIVHERGTDSRNLLAVEVKRSENSRNRQYDHLKLQALREELGYKFTLFCEFGPDGEVWKLDCSGEGR